MISEPLTGLCEEPRFRKGRPDRKQGRFNDLLLG
jgi:hypothetical protein